MFRFFLLASALAALCSNASAQNDLLDMRRVPYSTALNPASEFDGDELEAGLDGGFFYDVDGDFVQDYAHGWPVNDDQGYVPGSQQAVASQNWMGKNINGVVTLTNGVLPWDPSLAPLPAYYKVYAGNLPDISLAPTGVLTRYYDWYGFGVIDRKPSVLTVPMYGASPFNPAKTIMPAVVANSDYMTYTKLNSPETAEVDMFIGNQAFTLFKPDGIANYAIALFEMSNLSSRGTSALNGSFFSKMIVGGHKFQTEHVDVNSDNADDDYFIVKHHKPDGSEETVDLIVGVDPIGGFECKRTVNISAPTEIDIVLDIAHHSCLRPGWTAPENSAADEYCGEHHDLRYNWEKVSTYNAAYCLVFGIPAGDDW
jgi:hypothetical protein